MVSNDACGSGCASATLSADLKASQQQYIDIIEGIGRETSAINLFVAVVANLTIAPAEVMTEATYGDSPAKIELLAFYLYPLFDESDVRKVDPRDSNACWDALDKLFAIRALAGISKIVSDPALPDIVQVAWGNAAIVRSSAFPEQTAAKISSIQSQFDAWFVQHAGISPSRVLRFINATDQLRLERLTDIMPTVNERANEAAAEWRAAKRTRRATRTEGQSNFLQICSDQRVAWLFGYISTLNDVSSGMLTVHRESLLIDGEAVREDEWNTFVKLIGLTVADRTNIADPIGIRERPLYVLPSKSVMLVDIGHTLDIVWDRFEAVARSDDSFYQKYYQRTAANWLEEQLKSILSGVFPAASVYSGLSYPDPDKPSGATAEVDLIIYFEPFLIFAEAKAKQFRLAGQLGDLGRLKTDLIYNVQDAFDQARRANKYVDGTGSPIFTEIDTGRKLQVDKARINRTYLITVSLNSLAGLATRLAALQSINLFKDGEYPLAISIADLEVLSWFCDGPDVLLHYIARRMDVQRTAPEVIGEELDLLGAYLDARLEPSQLWTEHGKKWDNVALIGGWSERFNKWMMWKRGDIEEEPNIRLNVPPEIAAVLAELRSTGSSRDLNIAFAILDLPEHCLVGLAGMLRQVRGNSAGGQRPRYAAHLDGDTVFVVMAGNNVELGTFEDQTVNRTKLEKYRRKADRAIGIGIDTAIESPAFSAIALEEYDWTQSSEYDAIIAAEPAPKLAPGTRMPGRNEPCHCGSGRKFKQCCLRKL